MSRCFSCDTKLTNFESVRKSKITNNYLDLCETCFTEISDIFIEEEEKLDLKPKERTE